MLHLLRADLRLCQLDPTGMSLVIRNTRKVLIRTWRSSLALARTSASAMVFAATRLLIALSPRSAAHVLSRRSAGKWNWKREVSGSERATTSIWDCFLLISVASKDDISIPPVPIVLSLSWFYGSSVVHWLFASSLACS